MAGGDTHLYIETSEATPNHGRSWPMLGRLAFRRIEQPPTRALDGLVLVFDWLRERARSPKPGGEYRWAWIAAHIESQRTGKIIGRVVVPADQLPSLFADNPTIRWEWHLTHEEIEAIESERSTAPRSPLTWNLFVEGIVQRRDEATDAVGFAVYRVSGNGDVSSAVSDWVDQLLPALGFETAPSAAALVGASLTEHPSWKDAADRLAGARSMLARGECHPSLERALSAFEAIVTAPYDASRWSAWLADRYDDVAMPTQKSETMARLLAAHCSYLNRVGHHRSREATDPAGDLVVMPVDQWEASAVLAEAQFLLAYAIRLDAGRTMPHEEARATVVE